VLRFHNKHASFEERNQLIADRLPHQRSWVLDVGSNTGYTSQFLGELGHFVLGVEKMEDEYNAARKIAGETSAFMRVGVSPEFFRNSPQWSAILLLSVLHRIYAFEGQDCMREVLAECGKKTDMLFVEGSTRHARYKDQGQPAPDFTEHDVEAAAVWHEAIFADVLGPAWSVESKHVLKHTKKEPHRILFHLSKKNT
jgi:SAM-dependent methyltransferase